MEATTASEAMKVAFRSNMHMDSRVIEVAGFKSEAIFIALSLATLIGPLPSCLLDDGGLIVGLCHYRKRLISVHDNHICILIDEDRKEPSAFKRWRVRLTTRFSEP